MTAQHILLIPVNLTALRELLLVAQVIVNDPSFKPVVVVNKPEFATLAAQTAPEIEILKLYEMPTLDQPLPWLLRWGARLPHRLREGLRLAEIAERYQGFMSYFRHAQALLAQYQPLVMLTTGDRHLTPEVEFIAAARAASIPIVIIPHALNSSESIAHLREGRELWYINQQPQRLLKTWIRWRYPQQVYEGILYLNPVTTLSLALAGFLPPKPWIMGASHATHVGVIGQKDYQQALDQGIPPEKLAILGQVSLDVLCQAAQGKEQLRQRLIEQYHLDPQRKTIICSLPQLYEHNFLSWEDQWAEITFLMETFTHTNANVLLSLHPKMDLSRYQQLATDYPVHFLDLPLRTALPLADLFVATLSSTIYWAILLHTPTLMFDFHELDDHQMDDLQGLVRVYEKPQFAPALARLLTNPDHYADQQALLRQMAAQLAPFDGKAGARILALLHQLRAESPP